MRSEALKQVLEAKGATAALARNLGVTPQAISQWDDVPAERVIAVERFTGVPRQRLRPDLYPEQIMVTSEAGEAA